MGIWGCARLIASYKYVIYIKSDFQEEQGT
jgi:hypothetical protein